MRVQLLLLFSAALGSLSATARADSFSGELELVSDYRYRGVSLSDRRPALQASLNFEHESGAYGQLWASAPISDVSSNGEVDVSAGYALELTDHIAIDLSATYYAYPGSSADNAYEITSSLEAGYGPLNASVGLSVAPPQPGTRADTGEKRRNTYAFAAVEYQLQSVPILLRASAGRERGPWDTRDTGNKWDWSVGMEADWKPATVGLTFAGSNAGSETLVASAAFNF